MWTGVIVLLAVAILAVLAWWFMDPWPKQSRDSRAPGIQPGRDYSL